MEAAPEFTRFDAGAWSIGVARGWRAEDRGEFAAIVPPHPDGVLRIYGFSLPEGLTAAGWVELAGRVHPPRGRPLVAVVCGDFRGCRTEFAAPAWTADGSAPDPCKEDRWLRGWLLHAAGVPLDATYTCPLSAAGRDDAMVAAMLDTLRLSPPDDR